MDAPAARDKTLRMSYRIGRGEQGVLTFEPYKSALLPHWRFKTVPIAQRSSKELLEQFRQYGDRNDFVGMDMCRKYLQMVSLPGGNPVDGIRMSTCVDLVV
jgi:hypothetical protein